VGHKITLDEQVLVYATRHALTGDPSVALPTVGAVRRAWPELSLAVRSMILRDIRETLDAGDGDDRDTQAWATLLTAIVTGHLDTAVPDDTGYDELGPDHGYPSEDELLRLAAFRGTARELMEYAESIWRNGAGVATERRTTSFGREEVVVTFVTGGWSGCEEVISVLNRTLARMYASRWERGGLHEFAFPAAVYDSDKPWDWAFPSGDPDTTDGPYREVRDRLATLEAQVMPE